MNDQNNPNSSSGQGGIDQETERRNRENETGQQSDALTKDQAGNETRSDQAEAGQSDSTQATDQGGSGFVGSTGDQSSDYLTKGENQDFQPEGQGASDSDAGEADITTGQPTSKDSTLDDGADTSR